MLCKTVALFLALAGAVTPMPSQPVAARGGSSSSKISVYAYGSGISGWQVYSGTEDGKAYISSDAQSNLTRLTWNSPSVNDHWNATRADDDDGDDGDDTGSSLGSFYIVTSSSAFESAGFQQTNHSAPSGAAMKGFFKYGSQIMWQNDSNYQSQFWAESTGVDGLYRLKWNADGADRENSVPVTVKTTAPSSESD